MADYGKNGTRDPSSHRTPEQVHKMDAGYNHRPLLVNRREERNQARAILSREGLVHKGDGKDVDHIHPVRSGGTNARSNLRVKSAHWNRGWDRNK